MGNVIIGQKYLNTVWPTKSWGDMIVVGYDNSEHVNVRFVNTGNEYVVNTREIKSGFVRDHKARVMTKTVCGVGYIGGMKFTHTNCTQAHNAWRDMIFRCYGTDHKTKLKSYKGCTVCQHWHNFQNFAEWWLAHNPFQDSTIDKDILIKGNKTYSPETCCLVPKSLNVAFVRNVETRGDLPIGVQRVPGGNKINPYRARLKKHNKTVELGAFPTVDLAFAAYKVARESYIKQLAEEFRDKIEPKVYDAMMNYEVLVTD